MYCYRLLPVSATRSAILRGGELTWGVAYYVVTAHHLHLLLCTALKRRSAKTYSIVVHLNRQKNRRNYDRSVQYFSRNFFLLLSIVMLLLIYEFSSDDDNDIGRPRSRRTHIQGHQFFHLNATAHRLALDDSPGRRWLLDWPAM